MDSFDLLAYANLDASRRPLQQLLACLNFTLESEDILLVPMKKVISMNYGSTSCWKPWRWVSLDLIFSIRDVYINSNLNPLTKFMSSSRSIELKGILPCRISQMITKTISIITRIVISYAMKQGIPLSIWWKAGLGMTRCHPYKLRKRRLRRAMKSPPKGKAAQAIILPNSK